MVYLITVAAAYLFGTLPVRAWVGTGRGRFVRASLVPKELWIAGLEMAKGALATLIGLLLGGWIGASLAAVAVVFGETFPPGYASARGSGVTTAAGALLVLSPLLLGIGAFIYILSLLITRCHPFSALCAALGIMLIGLILSTHLYVFIVIFCLAGFVLPRLRKGRNRFRKPFRWLGPFRRG